ncbi:MAG: tetratricopeptide repeat protein [Bacillota bacterium]
MAKRDRNRERNAVRRQESRQDNLSFIFIIAVGLLLAVGIGIMIGMTIGGARDRAAAPPTNQTGSDPSSQLIALEARVAKNPNDAQALYDLADAVNNQGDYAKAVGYYERALALRPNDLNIMTDLGTAYYYSGDPDKGLDTYAKVLKVDPKFQNALYNKGVVLLYGKKDKAGAAAAIQAYLAAYPSGDQADQARKLLEQTK